MWRFLFTKKQFAACKSLTVFESFATNKCSERRLLTICRGWTRDSQDESMSPFSTHFPAWPENLWLSKEAWWNTLLQRDSAGSVTFRARKESRGCACVCGDRRISLAPLTQENSFFKAAVSRFFFMNSNKINSLLCVSPITAAGKLWPGGRMRPVKLSNAFSMAIKARFLHIRLHIFSHQVGHWNTPSICSGPSDKF